ncbi:endothelin-converting enzyme 2 [Calliphora vicina]|uniref:endothelin-converting enzyme 2 n=1 Tax=Calliphora vicina TaxID=7373 RepID=UPI00325BBB15
MWLKQRSALIVIALVCFTVQATTDALSPSKSLNTTTPTIFKLPTTIDEDDLLHEMALFMKDNMNLAEDPCEDFYEFACGNWSHSPRVPQRGHNDTFLHAIQLELNDLMVDFLKNSTRTTNKTAEAKAKQFYTSCVVGGKDVSVGVKTLLDSEKETFEKLKLSGENDWLAVNLMSPYGVYALLPLHVNYSTTSRQFEVSLSLPIPLLQHFHNSSNSKDLLQTLGLDSEEFQLMLEFERNLTSKAQELETVERVTIKKFLHLHEQDPINWKTFFKMAFPHYLEDDWYVSNKVANFTHLERFLRKSHTENLRNYIKWRTILKFYNIWKDQISGDDHREQICRQHTESYFTYALMPWFIEVLYDQERREDSLKIADAIQNQFFEMIANYTWLDEETKSKVKTKLRAMDVAVGYKDEMRHRTLSNQIYSTVQIGTDWFKNLENLEAYRAGIRLNSVHKTIVPPMLSPFNVNAYYVDYINTAFITMGISQMPLYNVKFPDSLKFGGIGMLIGHEMAHGFDSNGYLVNYDGKRHQWLSPASLRNFKERYSCLENQYNKFIYRGVQTNGSATMPDNIADNAGLRFAYHAYRKHLASAKESEEKPLPGLNFSNNELFYIKFAQSWCTGRDDSYKMRHIKLDHHAYGEFRVLGPLRNMPEFAQTFNCKLGTQMNPLKKCVVW